MLPSSRWRSRRALVRDRNCARDSTANKNHRSIYRQERNSAESGNVVVEFVGVMIILVVPALLALLATSSLLMGQAAITAAARDGARAFVRAESVAQGRHRATDIAAEAFDQRGVDADVTVDFVCSATPCLTPGAAVTTTVRATVRLTSVGMTVTLDESLRLPVDELREERE